MASAIASLVYTCALLPLLAARHGKHGLKPCVFPFIYKKMSFSSCTTYGTPDEKLWCATTHYYESDNEWKWCTTKEYGGNSHGKPCVFPFFYKKKTYYTCIPEKSTSPWCATTGSYDEDKKWSCCADTRLSDERLGPCIFPFVFEGKSRLTCVTDGSPQAKPFCSLTDHYDADLYKVDCADSVYKGCSFPFTYKDQQYCVCTRDGTVDGPLWCATTSDFDENRKWKPCEQWRSEVPEQETEDKKCSFPFTYSDQIYTSCTTDGSFWSRHWCYTKSKPQGDDWKYCDGACD